jgi:MFS transporter, DHA1 family, inner membrane transport protein
MMDTGELRLKWVIWRSAAWWPAVLLVLVQSINGMWYMPQLSFFPVYLQELGLPPAAIGGIVAGGQLAGMAVALLGGWVTGMLGSKWVLVCGLALSGVASLVFQIHTAWLAAVLWFIGGAGLALITVGGASYLTRVGMRGTLGMLAAFYALSMTVGGAIGTPIAGVIIERRGFSAFGWAETAVIAIAGVLATIFMIYLQDRTPERASLRVFWSGALAMLRRVKMRQLLGLRCLPTIFYGMLTVLIPVLLNSLSGNKLLVAAYATTNLVVASAAQLLAGRAADRWGARRPTLIAYSAVILAGLGLAVTVSTVWGLFIFGVLGVAAAWSLSTLMYVWVKDGVAQPEHASSFGLLHAVWSLSMITGSLLGGALVRTFPGLPFLVAGLLNIGSLFLALAYYARPAAQDASTSVTH